MATVSALGRTVCVLIIALREAREREESTSRFFQAVGDGATFKPPFSKEGLSLGLDLLPGGVGVDYVVVVGRHFFVQAVRRVCEQVSMLCTAGPAPPAKGAASALSRPEPPDDNEFWSSQAARDQVVEQSPPSSFAFPTHPFWKARPDTPGAFGSRPSKRGVEYGFEKLLYEATNARPNLIFQGIEPIIAQRILTFRGACRRPCAIRCHGVISVGALTPILVCFHKLEITPASNSTTPATAPDQRSLSGKKNT
jgi:hypothetical protein